MMRPRMDLISEVDGSTVLALFSSVCCDYLPWGILTSCWTESDNCENIDSLA